MHTAHCCTRFLSCFGSCLDQLKKNFLDLFFIWSKHPCTCTFVWAILMPWFVKKLTLCTNTCKSKSGLSVGAEVLIVLQPLGFWETNFTKQFFISSYFLKTHSSVKQLFVIPILSILQKFLLRLPGGIFGKDGEATLLSVLTLQHKMEQFEAVHA